MADIVRSDLVSDLLSSYTYEHDINLVLGGDAAPEPGYVAWRQLPGHRTMGQIIGDKGYGSQRLWLVLEYKPFPIPRRISRALRAPWRLSLQEATGKSTTHAQPQTTPLQHIEMIPSLMIATIVTRLPATLTAGHLPRCLKKRRRRVQPHPLLARVLVMRMLQTHLL